jgi:hypothetical protein
VGDSSGGGSGEVRNRGRRKEYNVKNNRFKGAGVYKAEHLWNMSHHDCREQPNVRFAPDKTMVFFTSNLFGASYVFGVAVKKAANPAASECERHDGAGAAVEATALRSR